jgi:hypothetical protein
MSSGGGAPQLSSAFIDLATYGELESYLYGPVETRDYNRMYASTKQSINMWFIVVVIILLFYLKKKRV